MSTVQANNANDLYEKALDFAVENGSVSQPILKKHFGINDDAAREILRRMEKDGIIDPFKRVRHPIRPQIPPIRLLQPSEVDDLEAPAAFAEKHGLVGTARSWLQAMQSVLNMSSLSGSVLLCGATGTGKELVARALHKEGNCANKPFVAVNVGVLTRETCRSELFGYVKGAFTGAHTNCNGLFVAASGGTLFLDDIQLLDSDVQGMLLRALQEKKILPLGSKKEIDVEHVRVIVSTNEQLDTLVAQERFREDLYYRINALPITLPSLKDRKEDIDLLVKHFLKKHGQAYAPKLVGFDSDTMEVLREREWRGNVRELENAVISILAHNQDKGVVTPLDLPAHICRPETFSSEFRITSTESLYRAQRKLEEWLVRRTLQETRGDVAKAAKRLEIRLSKMTQLIAEYEIDS